MERHCWEVRGCPEDMELHCPFARANAPCELNCHFTFCPAGQDFNIMENVLESIGLSVEKGGAVKEQCFSCRVYLKYLKKTSGDGQGS